MTEPAVRHFGDRALLVEVESTAAAHRLAAALGADPDLGRAGPSITGVVVGFASVVVLVDEPEGSSGPVFARVDSLVRSEWWRPPGTDATSPLPPVHRPRRVEVPVTFDGPDLDEVAATIGRERSEVEELLVDTELEVAFVGFAPGFPYLTGLPPELASLRRRPTPRPSVPAGSVALAGGFASVYPRPTPGGWLLVGTTTTSLFDPEVPPYALVRAGDTLRFTRRAGHGGDPAAAPVAAPGSAQVDTVARTPLHARTDRWAEVVDPGVLSTVQDRGRRGVADIGVPDAGAADPDSLLLANRLVGNGDDAASIEVTARGPSIRFGVDAHVTVVATRAGAVDVALDGRTCPDAAVVPVAPGQVLGIGRVRSGLRAYLAVAGGFGTPEVMGSRSSDLLSGLGTGRLVAGDRLDLGVPVRPHGILIDAGVGNLSGASRTVRVVAGPHLPPDDTWARLLDTRWRVDGTSDRIGVRLVADRGPAPTGGVSTGGVSTGGVSTGGVSTGGVSTGMVTGAIQLPPDGRPIILLPDHATVGGYPVVGCVIAADQSLTGQLAPGDPVRFSGVDLDTAHRAWLERGRLLDTRVRGWFPTAAGT